MDVAVIGYKTTLGRSLRDKLRQRGCIVREITREHLSKLPPLQLGEWLSGCSAVLDVTSTPYIAKWTGRYQYGLYADRLSIIRSITTALKYSEKKPGLLLNLSNCMVYDKYDVHDDFSSQYDDGFMAEVGEMELSETMKAKEVARDTRIVLLRTGYVMSSTSAAFKVLRNSAKIGIGGIIDDGYQCLPMIHEEDLESIIEEFVFRDDVQGIYNVTIPNMASMSEMMESIYSRISRRQITLPKWMLKILMGRAVLMLEHNCKAIPSRLTTMGYAFKYPDVDSIMEKCFGEEKKAD